MTARPLNVLHVVDSLGMGGAETWLMALLRHWSSRRAVQMDLILTGGTPQVFDEEARDLGASLHYLRYGRRQLMSFVRGFRRLLREGAYDAIHDHADYASGWHFLWGAGTLPPVRVTHVHNPWLHVDANYAISPVRRLATEAGNGLVHRLASHVCGTSAEILARYGFVIDEQARPRVSVLHCGFDVDRFNAPRERDRAGVLAEFGWAVDTKLVLFAGRLDRVQALHHPQNHKNSWFALNVVREALLKDPSVRFLMAGAGEGPRRELEAHIRSWGLDASLRLLGVREDLPRLMRAADLLLFPSVQEGLGMVAVEAQAASLPVLASTAVPRECVVVPVLYRSQSLDEPITTWADALLEHLAFERPSLAHCRQALASSPFSIVESARRLEAIYRSATDAP